MKGMIDIEYETLKKAIQAIEQKKGTCDKLPSARFIWDSCRLVGDHLQVGNHMPTLRGPDQCSDVEFQLLVCDQMGNFSTGTSAAQCENCLHKAEVEARHQELQKLMTDLQELIGSENSDSG